MNSYKKEKIQEEINNYVGKVIEIAAAENKLDFFQIEISNHNGNLQLDYSLRYRKKVY